MVSFRELRRRAGLTQPELARRARMHQTSISALELGKAEDPRGSTLKRLAVVLGVTVPDVMASLQTSARERRRNRKPSTGATHGPA